MRAISPRSGAASSRLSSLVAVFSTISNVLKVRHDTVKNTIQNVH